MIDNEVLKVRLKDDLRRLKLTAEQEEQLVKELNYLSNLLLDINEKERQINQEAKI